MAITKRKRKLKNGKTKTVFIVEIYNHGVRVDRKTCATLKQAAAWQDDRNRLYKNPRAVRPASDTLTFRDTVSLYVDFLKPRVREQSFSRVVKAFDYLEKSPIATWSMADLSGNAPAIDEVLTWFRKQPFAETKGRTSFKFELRRLKAVFNWFREYKDPGFTQPVQRRHFEAAVITKKDRRQDYYLEASDVQRWLDYLRDNQRHAFGYQIAMLMVYTGLRVGEAAGLCWDMVNLEKRYFFVSRTAVWQKAGKDKTAIQAMPKTVSSVRTIAIVEPILTLLTDLAETEKIELRKPNIAEVEAEKKLNPVFKEPRTAYVPTYKQIQNAFNRGFKALGLDFSSTHILRHTNATLCFKELRDLAAIQAHLGHGSRSITERYAKVVALRDGRVSETALAAIGNRDV